MRTRTPPPEFDSAGDPLAQAPAFVAAAPPRKPLPNKLEVALGMLLVALFMARLITAASPSKAVAVRPIEKGKVIVAGDVESARLYPAADFRDVGQVVGHVAARDVAAGRPLRKGDVGEATRARAGRKALRDVAPYRILTAADVENPPRHAMALRGVRRGALLANEEVAAIEQEHGAVTIVRVMAAPPHMQPGIAAILHGKGVAVPVRVQLLKALDDDHYVVACRATDAAGITASRVSIAQVIR
jgi:hypothetical protein